MNEYVKVLALTGWPALIVVLAFVASRRVTDQPRPEEDEALMRLTPDGDATVVESVRRDWARSGCRCGCGDAA